MNSYGCNPAWRQYASHWTTSWSSPAQPQHQSALATALAEFTKSADKLAMSITPSQVGEISEMGGAEFFDPKIADKIKASISTNAMTPSVARDYAQDLATRRAAFLANVTTTLQGLEKLNIKQVSLAAGAADLAFLIPIELFDDNLGAFAKELSFIIRLIQDVWEGVTGNPEQVRLESLSSSILTIALGASVAAIATLANIVNKFLDAGAN